MRIKLVVLATTIWSFISPLLTSFKKELCKNDEYAVGKWKPVEIGKKSFYCCQNQDVGVVSSCGSREVLSDGYFQFDELIIASNLACSCDIADNTRTSVNPREKYEWEPDNCYMETFNGDHFCELLGKRRILLIGDSLMHQVSTVLVNILTAHNATCINQIAHGKASHLFFGHNGPKTFHIHFRDNNGADICIVNAGAHLDDDGDMNTVWDALLKWRNELQVD